MAPGSRRNFLLNVVKELIETERKYVRDLRMIVEDYLSFIIDGSDLSLCPEMICSLFGNIEDIYEFNSELLQDLDLCDLDPVAVARCFVMKSEYFEVYTQYCTNYPSSVAALTEIMSNASLARWFRDRQASLDVPLPLGSYLLKPVQRILKYHLLLQEIANHFDPEEAGQEVVEEAIATMTAVAWYINAMKRRHEHAVRLQEVQSLLLGWSGPDLTTYGELVLEGTFRVQRARNHRTLFLFERMLLVTRRRRESYGYKTHITCSTLMLMENSRDSLSFSVAHYKHPKHTHTVQAKSVEEKKLWTHHIKRIILENHHAIIPQRAKDAILEMDSVYAPRFRYSPERLRKTHASMKQTKKNSSDSPAERSVLRQTEDGRVPSNKAKHEVGGATTAPEQDGRPPRQRCGPALPSDPPSDPPSKPSSELPSSPPSDPPSEPPSEPSTCPCSPSVSVSSREPEVFDPEEEAEPGQDLPSDPSPTAPDPKVQSSSESSDEEDDQIPSSVLDKAGAITQHFTSGVGQGVPSLGRSSPRPPSRPRLPSSSSEQTEIFVDLIPPPLRDDPLPDRGVRCRRDSALSERDLLLIGKIKTFYENQDTKLRLQRRESLTNIPPGLVRTSVSRFNSVLKKTRKASVSQQDASQVSSTDTQDHALAPPTDTRDHALASPTDTRDHALAPPTDTRDHPLALPTDTRDHPLAPPTDNRGHPLAPPTETWNPSLAPPTETRTPPISAPQRLQGPKRFRERLGSWSEDRRRNQGEVEQLRPSSEVILIWQAMEQKSIKSQRPDRRRGPGGVVPRARSGDGADQQGNHHTATKDPPGSTGLDVLNRAGSSRHASTTLEEEHRVVAAPGPQGRGSDPGPDAPDNTEKTKSKVLHLARQFSQRIRTSGPAAGGQSQSSPAPEEKEECPGKLDLSDNRPAARTPSPSSPPSSSSSPDVFYWPDVHQLRSRYSERSIDATASWTGSMPEGSGRRRSSCEATGPKGRRQGRLQRANSLDPRVSGLLEFQDQVYAAETPLQSDHKHEILAAEKRPEREVSDDDYVEIRSPTSREKFSMVAVADRRRVYQDSEQNRDEAGTQDEPLPNDQDRGRRDQGVAGRRSLVKNLREKFQNLN